jgi:hypothetical protein
VTSEDRGTDAQDGAKGSEEQQGPAVLTPGANAPNVITAAGADAAKAYVPPTPLPKGREPAQATDLVKVDIADKRALELLDPRKAVTTKMAIPPGGLRPPPAPMNEGAGADSPWSQSGGLDRTALPSAALGATAVPKPAPARAEEKKNGGGGVALWLGVILGAVLLGGGLAFAVKQASAPPKPTTTTPIAVTVTPQPGALPLPAPAAEPTPEATAEAPQAAPTAEATAAPTGTSSAAAPEEQAGAAPSGSPTGAKWTAKPKTTATSAPTAAPTTTTKRLFD